MRDNTSNGRNLNRAQVQDNSTKCETPGIDFNQLGNSIKSAPNVQGHVAEEAIDVLSFMGFKL